MQALELWGRRMPELSRNLSSPSYLGCFPTAVASCLTPPGHLIYAADAGVVSKRVEPEEVYRMCSYGFKCR